MSFYKNGLVKDGEEYILYGFEGNICIWQLKKATSAKKRLYYANPGRGVEAHTVSEIRSKIREVMEE